MLGTSLYCSEIDTAMISAGYVKINEGGCEERQRGWMRRVLEDAMRITFVMHSKDASHATLALHLNVLICHSFSPFEFLVICKANRKHCRPLCRFYDHLIIYVCLLFKKCA